MQEFTARGYKVTAPELPGHGARTAERFPIKAAIHTIESAVAQKRCKVFCTAFRWAVTSPRTMPAWNHAPSPGSSSPDAEYSRIASLSTRNALPQASFIDSWTVDLHSANSRWTWLFVTDSSLSTRQPEGTLLT